MRNKQRRLVLLTVILWLCLHLGINVKADEAEEMMKEVGFTYTINHPKNQIGKTGALNLLLTPGQEQTVTVTIHNSNEQEVKIDLSLNGARTNGNGGLEYGPNEFKADESMVYDITDLVQIPNELKIPPKNDRDIELVIKMPENPYKGIITGGVQMMEKEGEKETTTETAIVNKIAYLFGITLQMSEEELVPKLDLQSVYPEQANFRNAIFMDVANKEAMKIDGLMIDVEVTKKGKTDVLYDSKKNNMEMAPNTIMAYPISLGGEKMIAGDYTAHVYAAAHEKEWEWEKDFTITKEQADMFNQKDVSIVQERGVDWKLIVGIASALLFIMTIIYFIYKVKKQKQEKIKRKTRKKQR